MCHLDRRYSQENLVKVQKSNDKLGQQLVNKEAQVKELELELEGFYKAVYQRNGRGITLADESGGNDGGMGDQGESSGDDDGYACTSAADFGHLSTTGLLTVRPLSQPLSTLQANTTCINGYDGMGGRLCRPILSRPAARAPARRPGQRLKRTGKDRASNNNHLLTKYLTAPT